MSVNADHTIVFNFDAVTSSPVPDWLITALKTAFVVALYIINPVAGLLAAIFFIFLGIFETQPPTQNKRDVLAAAYFTDGTPIEGLKIYYHDRTGERLSGVTDSNGHVTISLDESDTAAILKDKKHPSPYGELLIGKDPNDATEYKIKCGVQNVLFFRLAQTISDSFNVKVVTETGTPIVGATVFVLLVSDKIAEAKTDALGIAKFSGGLERGAYGVAAAAISGTGTQLVGTQHIDLRVIPYPDPITTITVSDKAVITVVKRNPNGVLLDGVTATLIGKNGNIVATTQTVNGYANFLVVENEADLYTIQQEKAGYKPQTTPNVPGKSDILPETTDFDNAASVTVKLVLKDSNETITGRVTLRSGTLVLGPQYSVEVFQEVPYGTYTVEVAAEGYQIVPADATQVCNEACGSMCNWTIRMTDVNDPTGDKSRMQCKVTDEDGNPVPDAFIEVDYHTVLSFVWESFDLATWGTILKGEIGLTSDGQGVICDGEGLCDFQVPKPGKQLQGDLSPISVYRVRASHKDYYNEKGKKGGQTEWIEVPASVSSPILFTLTKTPEVIPSMLLICAVATAGLAIGGTVIKAKSKGVGTAVQLSALIPGALTAYEGYKYVKSKLGWLGG